MRNRKIFTPKSVGLNIVWTYIRYVGWLFDVNCPTTQVVLSYLIINADPKTGVIELTDLFVKQIAKMMETTDVIVENAIQELYSKKAILRKPEGTKITEDLFLRDITDTTEMRVEFTFKH